MNSIARKCLPAILALATPLLLSAEYGSKLTAEEIEKFLLTAKLVKVKELGTGVTHSQKATLAADDGLQHDAHVQTIDEAKTTFQTDRGTEMNFRDTWKFNIAGYKLDRILGLNMTPPSVERSVNGKSAAVTWWLDDTMMEVDRQKKKLTAPDQDSWNREMYILRVFDQLIFNTDRNLQNLMIDKDWHIWFIDHTRAFRLHTSLKSVKDLVKCDRVLLGKLRELNTNMLSPLKPYLTDGEIKGLLGRRDKIVKFFDDQVKLKGEAAVLYDRPAR